MYFILLFTEMLCKKFCMSNDHTIEMHLKSRQKRMSVVRN